MNVNFDISSLPKLESFDGTKEKWATFRFKASSYFGLLKLKSDVVDCEKLDEDPKMEEITEEYQGKAELLYHVLVQVLKGPKAELVAMNAPEGNGFALWRNLLKAT